LPPALPARDGQVPLGRAGTHRDRRQPRALGGLLALRRGDRRRRQARQAHCRRRQSQRRGGRVMRYLLQRIAFYIFTAWAALPATFQIALMIPGDPVPPLIGRFQGQISPQALPSLYVLFGLDKHTSLWSQYWQYWDNLLHGDFGLSFLYFPTPVSSILKQS